MMKEDTDTIMKIVDFLEKIGIDTVRVRTMYSKNR